MNRRNPARVLQQYPWSNRLTGNEWAICAEPEAMLRQVQRQATDRKLRLFAVACCRHIGDLIQDPRSRTAVDVGEQFADGRVRPEVLRCAHAAAAHAEEEAFWAGFQEANRSGLDWPARRAATATAAATLAPFRVACEASTARVWAGGRRLEEMQAAKAEENRFQCDILRDLFGNLWAAVSVDAAWLSWHAGTVVAQARAIYEHGQFTQLPLLAEVLTAAGCTNPEVLGHCFQPGPHVRGCWVLDLLFAKE